MELKERSPALDRYVPRFEIDLEGGAIAAWRDLREAEADLREAVGGDAL